MTKRVIIALTTTGIAAAATGFLVVRAVKKAKAENKATDGWVANLDELIAADPDAEVPDPNKEGDGDTAMVRADDIRPDEKDIKLCKTITALKAALKPAAASIGLLACATATAALYKADATPMEPEWEDVPQIDE